MASTIKVNNIQNQCGANIANKCGSTITLGASGDTITLACGASQTGFGRTGTVDWDTTAKTASFTAVSGNGYFVNTTSGAITVTLPASPSAGDIVGFNDYARTFGTNNLTVARNGSNIQGVATDATISTEGQSTMFVYVDATKGWIPTEDQTTNNYGFTGIVASGGTVTTCGDYKIHTFTAPGTFTVCSLSSVPAINVVSYMVVAGGGGAGGDTGGGGGAGGFREYKNSCDPYTASPLNGNPGGTAITLTATGYPITVGAGGGPGAGAPPGGSPAKGGAGSNSVFSTITSTGGGGGGSRPCVPGNPGGSGGGSRSIGGSAGSGNTPPVSPPQGNDGGGATPTPVGNAASGGGATAAGAYAQPCKPTSSGGDGGAGAGTGINPSPSVGDTGPDGSLRYFAGGGAAGGGGAPCQQGGAGGVGGGADGANGGTGIAGENGQTNTGGGAGSGNDDQPGGSGGSGIVIIRYRYQ